MSLLIPFLFLIQPLKIVYVSPGWYEEQLKHVSLNSTTHYTIIQPCHQYSLVFPKRILLYPGHTCIMVVLVVLLYPSFTWDLYPGCPVVSRFYLG